MAVTSVELAIHKTFPVIVTQTVIPEKLRDQGSTRNSDEGVKRYLKTRMPLPGVFLFSTFIQDIIGFNKEEYKTKTLHMLTLVVLIKLCITFRDKVELLEKLAQKYYMMWPRPIYGFHCMVWFSLSFAVYTAKLAIHTKYITYEDQLV